MHELLVMTTGETIKFPSDIDELTPEQYLFYISLALKYMNGEIADPFLLKKELFTKLVDLKVSARMATYTPETQEQIWSSVTDKINLLDSFFDIEEQPDGNKIYKMHLDSAVNLLPQYGEYFAESSLIESITNEDFMRGLDCFRRIQQAGNEGDLEAMNANTLELFNVIYRPKGPALVLKEIPAEVAFHIVNYFGFFIEVITSYPLTINGNVINFSVLFPKPDEDEEENRKEGDLGWNGIFFNVAETGVFGNMNEVMKEKLITTLMFLYKQYMDAKELESKQNKTAQ